MKPVVGPHHTPDAMPTRWLLSIVILFTGCLLPNPLPGSVATAQGADGRYTGKQGEISSSKSRSMIQ